MLSKKFRFHSRGGVRYVYQKGKTIRSPKMSLIFVENTRKFTRIAVVVSKKVLKSAVGRNRIRRRVYEVIRLRLDSIPKGVDYIFVIYDKKIIDMPFGEIGDIVDKLVDESKICYNKENK